MWPIVLNWQWSEDPSPSWLVMKLNLKHKLTCISLNQKWNGFVSGDNQYGTKTWSSVACNFLCAWRIGFKMKKVNALCIDIVWRYLLKCILRHLLTCSSLYVYINFGVYRSMRPQQQSDPKEKACLVGVSYCSRPPWNQTCGQVSFAIISLIRNCYR